MTSGTHENLSGHEGPKGGSDRAFGFVFAFVFGIIGLWPLIRSRSIRVWALVIAAVFLLVALALPRVLHPLNVAWTRFSLVLSRITNPIITGLMFYLIFTPVALVLRVMGKDHLRLKPEPDAGSYWIPRRPPGPPPDTMRNQF